MHTQCSRALSESKADTSPSIGSLERQILIRIQIRIELPPPLY